MIEFRCCIDRLMSQPKAACQILLISLLLFLPNRREGVTLPQIDPQAPSRFDAPIWGGVAFVIGVLLVGGCALVLFNIFLQHGFSFEALILLPFAGIGVYFLNFSYRRFLFLRKNSRKPESSLYDSSSVKVRDIPRIYTSLKHSGSDGSFAAIMPTKRTKKSEDVVNLQFSIEDGSIGFDWVLISEVNIEDRGRFEALAKSRRFDVRESMMNGVQYLRTTDRNAANLCQMVLSDLYSLSADAELDLIVEGFSWP